MTRLEKARSLFDYEQNWRGLFDEDGWEFIKSECEGDHDRCVCKDIAASLILDGYPARRSQVAA